MSGIKRIKIIDTISQKYAPILAAYEVGGDEITDPDVIMVRSTRIDPNKLKLRKDPLAIARVGAGVDTINVKAATERGIVVIYAPGINAPPVAEHTFDLIKRRLHDRLRPIEENLRFVASLAGKTQGEIDDAIKKNKSNYKGHGLAGWKLGIIGVGQVGRRVAQIGLGYGMEVIGYDVQSSDIPGLKWANSKDELLRSADIVSLHIRHTPGVTDNYIGRDEIALMRPNTILVNTARGELVDNAALLENLGYTDTPIAAYLSDFPMPELIGVEGIVCTSHIAASTEESKDQCAENVARDIDDFIKFGVIRNAVNFPTMEIFPRSEIVTRLTIIHRNVAGMINFMSGVLKSHRVNIEDHSTRKANGIAYTIIDLERGLPHGILSEIAAPKKILRVREIRFAK